MKVNNDNIQGLISGQRQFEVPIWQRQYKWSRPEHEQLWSDLADQYRQVAAGEASGTGHFFGTVVLSPRDPSATGVTHFLVIDGQQRLTTIMLVFCAIRDVAVSNGKESLREKYDDLYLLNKYEGGDDRFRLLPTEEDRGAFKQRLQGVEDNGARDRVSDAYRFYRDAVEGFSSDHGSDELEALASAAASRLEIVEITTQQGDDIHRIFQSLNGTGVALDQADLLRNHLFMLLPTRGDEVYENVWRPLEKRIGVDNLEALARLDLSRRGELVSHDRVYEAHQQLLTPIAADEGLVEERVRDLGYRAELFQKLIDPSSETHPELSAGLGRLARWGAQTAHPVLIRALDLREQGIIDGDAAAQAVGLIESFVVSRQVARVAPNALNKLFVQLVNRLPEDQTFVDVLHYELSRDVLNWPSDNAIRTALTTQKFYRAGRGHQRKAILERIERSYGHPEIIDFNEVDLQIEHVMPQTLSPEWREHLEVLGQDPDEVHDELVHTLGNLTLTAFNGSLSNDPFKRKAQIYGESHLELNKALASNASWGRQEILDRADSLADRIIKIWPAPIPGVTSDPGAFDWSRIDLAIERIPPSRWTTYGDLAELGGTAAVPVGQHVKDLPDGSSAYRVLSVEGTVSAGFVWADPSKDQDVHEVLMAEGIIFDENGAASADQRLSAEELAALVADLDEDEAEEFEI